MTDQPTIIAPRGDLDLHAARDLAPQLDGAAFDPSVRLVVDLSQTAFIDSTGLGAVVQAWKRIARQGRTMAIVAPRGSAAAVLLEMSGLARQLPVFETREAALAAP
jgi:anti-anti-sigma factor